MDNLELLGVGLLLIGLLHLVDELIALKNNCKSFSEKLGDKIL